MMDHLSVFRSSLEDNVRKLHKSRLPGLEKDL